ncbi:MAG: hypothetical protein RML72_04280 [Bacteroidia bacterium]|nr:hypothetical protein [Bacteroidia bacterium]MDW8158080.1 hypothetical protein [Bacteroidia bacterium]
MLHLDFSYSPWLILVCLLVAAALTSWMYFKIHIEIPKIIEWLLRGLRFFSLFLLSLLFLEPLVTLNQVEKTPAILTILQDGTQSMLAHKDSNFVKKEFPLLFKNFVNNWNNPNVNIHSYVFGNKPEKMLSIDSVSYNFSGTQLGEVLKTTFDNYTNQNLGAIVLISDGISTGGINPLYAIENSSVPIYTVLIGDTTEPRDLLIESINFNELTYKNTITPIQVSIRGLGIEQENVEVQLLKDGKLLQKQNVVVSKASNIAKVNFEVQLEKAGLQTFSVVINRIENEISYQNNQQVFFIKVLDTRLKIALLAGAPHPDLGALYKCLRRDDRYALKEFIRKNESEFYEPPTNLNEFDLFIFHNFPSSSNDRPILEQIYAICKSKKTPIIHLIGALTKFNIHPEQKDFMGAFPERISNTFSDAQLNISPAYKNHASYKFEDEKVFINWLETAPPLIRNDSEWKTKANTQVFGTAKIKGIALNYPVFTLQDNGGMKNIMIIGEGIWKWRMHAFLETESFDVFDEWIYNLIQWLHTKSDTRRFRVFPTKGAYLGTERVIIKGQVYDEANNPLKGAEIKLKLTQSDGKVIDYYLQENPSGNYQLELSNLEPGSYSFLAEGSKQGQNLGTDAGEFSVGSSPIEYIQLKADVQLMKQLALRTGGKFILARNFASLANIIAADAKLKPLLEYRITTQAIHRIIYPLIILLILLSIEWILRKRYGLI